MATGELDQRFSAEGATPAQRTEAQDVLSEAQTYWLATVRPDGRPHVTPLLAIWQDGAPHFCTGPTERKAKNLEQNRQVVLTTGQNSLDEGLDIVVEGEAVQVTDDGELRRLSAAYEAKYGSDCTSTCVMVASARATWPGRPGGASDRVSSEGCRTYVLL